jgi:hypothetical protein
VSSGASITLYTYSKWVERGQDKKQRYAKRKTDERAKRTL